MPPKRKTSSSAACLEALYTNKNFKWPKSDGLETLWEESPQQPAQLKRKRVITKQPIKRLIDFDKDTITKRRQKKQARVKKVKAVKGWMPPRKSKCNNSIEEKLNALLECNDIIENTNKLVSLKDISLCTSNNVLVPEDLNNLSCQKKKLADHFDIDHTVNEKTSCSGEVNCEPKTLHTNASLDLKTTNGNEVNLTLMRFTDLAANADTKSSDSCAQRCEDARLDSIVPDNDFCVGTEYKVSRPCSESVAISWYTASQTEGCVFCDNDVVEIHKTLGSDVHKHLHTNKSAKCINEEDADSATEMRPICADTIDNVTEMYLKAGTEEGLHSESVCSPNVLATEKNVEKENSFSLNAKHAEHQHSNMDRNIFSLSGNASNFTGISVFDPLSEGGCNELDKHSENVNEDMIQHVNFANEDIDNLICSVIQVHNKNKSKKRQKRRRDSTAAFSSLAQKLAQAESAFSSENEFCSTLDNE